MSEVIPYAQRVSQLIRRGDEARVQAALKDIARVLTDAVQSPEAVAVRAWRPRPWVKNWKLKARDAMLRVLLDTDPIKSGILVGAIFLLARRQPHRFITPLAFDHQLVRRWRGLASVAWASYWNDQEQRAVKVYRDLPPRSTQQIALYLRTAYERFVRFVVNADTKQEESLVPLM